MINEKGIKRKMKNDVMENLAKKSPWIDNENMIWLASTTNLSRNIEKFKFPAKLDMERRKQMISLVSKELMSMPEIKQPELLKAEEISPMDKEFLEEHYFAQENYQQTSQGEAFIIDDSGQFFTTLNIKDHIRLHYIECKGELESAWNRLVKIETALGKSIAYSFNSRFGFLTADPMECGTGLVVNAFVQLPALIHSGALEDWLQKNADEAISHSGFFGGASEYIGDIVTIRNNYTLGVNEETVLAGVRSYAAKLAAEEKKARSAIREVGSPVMKDKVSRAFAILIHSYQIEAAEALNAISLLKMGFDFGWVQGISVSKLNNLFFNCRRAHLVSNYKEKVSHEEISHRRAEFIHSYLKDVKLAI